MNKIHGLIAAPLTPMDKNGKINLGVIEEYAIFLKKNGVVGAFVNGTTGEGLSLTEKERINLAEKWVDKAPKDFKIIIHVGHTSIEATKKFAKNANDIGAYGIGAMGQIFFRANNVKDLVEQSYHEAKCAPDLPYYYYHIPSLSLLNFQMIDYLKEADGKIPNLAGIKFTFESLMDYELCRSFKNEKYDILFGRDEILLPALTMGAKGAIGSTYNIAAPLYNKIIQEFNNNNIQDATNLQRKAIEFIQILIKTNKFMASLKTIMNLFGLNMNVVRRPLIDLTSKENDKLEKDLKSIGFFEYCSKK